MADEYKQATKRQKGKILDILTALTGYTLFRTPRGGYDNGRGPKNMHSRAIVHGIKALWLKTGGWHTTRPCLK